MWKGWSPPFEGELGVVKQANAGLGVVKQANAGLGVVKQAALREFLR